MWDDVETRRLRAERMRPEHLEHLVAMNADPRVTATLGGLRSREETHDYLAESVERWELEGFGFWVWFDRATGEFVGRGGVRRVEIGGSEEAEVGYAIVAERWGEGLATEIAQASVEVGFEQLGLADLVAFTLPTNLASRRVMEKVGFVYERDVEYWALPHVLYRRRRPDTTRPS